MVARRRSIPLGPLFGPWLAPSRSPRSRRRRNQPAGLVLLIIVVLFVLSRVFVQQNPSHQGPDSWPEGIYIVDRVVDGDTLRLTNGETVRLIGVDTPETVKPHSPVEPFGHEAAALTRKLVQDNSSQVRLSFDAQRRDKYGRLLAYVWVGDRLLNEELVRTGLARVETQYSYSPLMKERLLLAEREARMQRRGIWSASDSDN